MIRVAAVLGPILNFVAAFTLTFTIGSAAYQERFCAPRRADAASLMRGVDRDDRRPRFCPPSPLSRYETIGSSPSSDLLTLEPLGVHYLEYSPPSPSASTSSWGEEYGPVDRGVGQDESGGASSDDAPRQRTRFDALHINHGFGASSLSFLTSLPSLAS